MKVPVELLGTMPDRVLAKLYSAHYNTVFNARKRLGIAPFAKVGWTEKVPVALLGTMPDAELARVCGVARTTIARHRGARCIPAWTPDRKRRPIDAWLHLLGTMTDRMLAQKSGIPKSTLNAARRRLGIAPYGRIEGVTREDGADFGEQGDASRAVLAALRKG